MARWKLTAKHYLNCPGLSQYAAQETSIQTNRVARKVFEVGTYLDPDDPSCHNYPREGEIIVCHKDKGKGADITFVGPPTADMEPIDDEARAISDAERPNWKDPINDLPAQGGMDYGERLVAQFEAQIAKLGGLQPTVPVANVSMNDFEALKAQVAELMTQNEKLKAGRRI